MRQTSAPASRTIVDLPALGQVNGHQHKRYSADRAATANSHRPHSEAFDWRDRGPLSTRNHHGMAPKIYHLHPLVAGKLSDWPLHFARCRAMGFDTVCVAPPFVPGASGDIFITGDHEALHPGLDWPGRADAGIARMAQQASEH